MIPLSIPSASRARTARSASSAAAPLPLLPDSALMTKNTLFNIVVIIAIVRYRCKEEIQGRKKTGKTKTRNRKPETAKPEGKKWGQTGKKDIGKRSLR
jgi:hypothetical protein